MSEIQSRLTAETKVNIYYYLGITIALASSALDVVTYFIIRKVGLTIPKSIFPFISGIVATTLLMVYCALYEPLQWGYFFSEDKIDPSKELQPNTDA